MGLAPLWGAALLVHLLQLEPQFRLQDICRQLLLEADMAGHSGAPLRPSSFIVESVIFQEL